jgi:hypothetical protein
MSNLARMQVFLITFTLLIAPTVQAAKKEATKFEKGAFEQTIPGCNVGKQTPWHLTSKDCETFLPDIHYADAVNNEQVMDLRLKDANGERFYQIDHLIYPTLGAPNLFFKYPDTYKDKFDEFVVMLNLPDSTYSPLLQNKPNNKRDSRLYLNQDARNGIKIYLSERSDSNRAQLTDTSKPMQAGSTVIELGAAGAPNVGFWRYGRDKSMPKLLKTKAKIKFIANKWAMKTVQPGFYDIRIDVLNNGKLVAAEYQYNATRIYEENYDQVTANILNVTDSQASLGLKNVLNGKSFKEETLDRLIQFSQGLNKLWSSAEKNKSTAAIKKSAFITFNGDVHNGGAPETLSPYQVANTYNWEAQRILAILKDLPLPIFLTAGNHDGYVAIGHMPAAAKLLASTIKEERDYNTVAKVLAHPQNGANFDQFVSQKVDAPFYLKYLEDTKAHQGGLAVNVFDSGYVRYFGDPNYKRQWVETANSGQDSRTQYHRNYVLYDGFNQWKRTYGPLAQSWSFGRNHFININSYELRQHMRTGWGMYTVNYGGGVSQHQKQWIAKEETYAANRNREINLLAHHDPRGGHKGVNFPFYFRQVPYDGMVGVAKNFVLAEMIMPAFCDVAPKFVVNSTNATFLGCMQDGLQEWLRPDSDFDCERKDMYSAKDVEETASYAKANKQGGDWRNYVIEGRCNLHRLSGKRHRIYSGYQLVDMMATNPNVRTVLLGHTHYNSLEVIASAEMVAANAYEGAKAEDTWIVPGAVVLDADSQKKYLPAHKSLLERFNPLRWMGGKRKAEREAEKVKFSELAQKGIFKASCNEQDCAVLDFEAAGHSFSTVRQKNELVILRLTSVANLTDQSEQGAKKGVKSFGFSVLEFGQVSNKPTDNKTMSRIERVDFLINDGKGGFEIDAHAKVDRKCYIPSTSNDPKKINPISQLFDSRAALPTPEFYEIKRD